MIFRHHPDGRLYLGSFQASLAEFVSQVPSYSLPAPFIGRYYDSVTHVLTDGANQSAGPVPWVLGEAIFSNTQTIVSAIVGSRPPPVPVSRGIPAVLTGVDGLPSLSGLTAQQLVNLWTDYATNARWATDTGSCAEPVRLVLDLAQQLGVTISTVGAPLKAKLLAFYINDNPQYAVNPAFDPTINIPGQR